ncbi:MAG: 4-hydroxy-tetrahydrodipicolinate reductase [Ferruginibacter sp.]|nr:4-hydroxy-tetrahydrodipicolinate reductase [Ferruginibacter sp.]MCB0708366.1 4-hydroxy-tetrahydrodipicolinate reductase [Chitinophagaceae bacterium]
MSEIESKNLNIALIGYGKMGKTIEAIALQRGHEIKLKIDIDSIAQFTKNNLQQCDVAIEFTGPHSAKENILQCLDAGIPVVSGSTGWLANWNEVELLCKEKNGSLLYASNFSIGVNIFFELNKKLAQLMKNHADYDISMEEIHHTQKKDAPSGTAITLAEQILAEIPHKKNWVNYNSENADDLVIISKREDPAPGTHSIRYSSIVDDIEIIHTAHNRQGFATGAVLAAEFIFNKKGVFSMKDVLGF